MKLTSIQSNQQLSANINAIDVWLKCKIFLCCVIFILCISMKTELFWIRRMKYSKMCSANKWDKTVDGVVLYSERNRKRKRKKEVSKFDNLKNKSKRILKCSINETWNPVEWLHKEKNISNWMTNSNSMASHWNHKIKRELFCKLRQR